jgi:predicted unusual protein kinase regulating ubiquinone biosynthesis (AarF/ABC1/UbiB family)
MSEENEIGPRGQNKRGALSLTLSASDRKTFLELFRTIAEFDGYRAGKLMVKCVHASR